jgi:RNA polymerase subunit RPABC4/transcription elongation factor Spt4
MTVDKSEKERCDCCERVLRPEWNYCPMCGTPPLSLRKRALYTAVFWGGLLIVGVAIAWGIK